MKHGLENGDDRRAQGSASAAGHDGGPRRVRSRERDGNVAGSGLPWGKGRGRLLELGAGASGEESRCPGQDCQPGGGSWQFEIGRRAFIGLARGQRGATSKDARNPESIVARRLEIGEGEHLAALFGGLSQVLVGVGGHDSTPASFALKLERPSAKSRKPMGDT